MSGDAIDIDVSPLAKKIGTWIATTSEFGLPDPIGGNDIEQAFAGEDARLVEEALAELEAEGLLTSTALMNSQFPRVRPTRAVCGLRPHRFRVHSLHRRRPAN